MAITCSDSTAHYASGCELLLHYDKDNNGIIDMDEVRASVDDYIDGVITDEEGEFVILCYSDGGSINKCCPNCYALIKKMVSFKSMPIGANVKID